MRGVAAGSAIGNPFCTRHVRPGRLPSFDAAGRPVDLAVVADRFMALGASAAIVGPHGSGKTTLLGHLAELLQRRGVAVVRVRIERGRDVVALADACRRARGGGTVCVDSWERLGRPCALLVRRWAVGCGARLLVTTHRPGPFPTLWECRSTPAVLKAIVARLPCEPAPAVGELDDAFARASGDLREALFLLYDLFEQRARSVRWKRPDAV